MNTDKHGCYTRFNFANYIVHFSFVPELLLMNPLEVLITFNVSNADDCDFFTMLADYRLHLCPGKVFIQFEKEIIAHGIEQEQDED